MDIPIKSRKRWSSKDVLHAQQQERAQAAAGAREPADAQHGAPTEASGVPKKQGRPGARSPREPAGHGPSSDRGPAR